MKPAPAPHLAIMAVPMLRVPPLAYHHVAVVLQVATARARADQASADLKARDARERERALRYVRVRERQ